MLTASEHRQVAAKTRAARNAARRADRAAPLHVVRVRLLGGGTLLAAQSRSTLGVAYEVGQDAAGHWRCSCAGYAWRGRCSHSEAGAALLGTTPLPPADVDHAEVPTEN